MYAPHNNPEMQERREDCGRGHERRERGERRGFGEGRFEGAPEGQRGTDRRGHGRPDGRGGRHGGRRGFGGRPDFAETGAALRSEMGLLRGAAVAVAAGGTPEQVAQAEAILAQARRALFELLAQKPADTLAE